jgi:hypothetical protein
VTPEDVLTWLAPRAEWAKLQPPDKLALRLPEEDGPAKAMAFLLGELEQLETQAGIGKEPSEEPQGDAN